MPQSRLSHDTTRVPDPREILDDDARLLAARRLAPVVPGNPTIDTLTGLAARLLEVNHAFVSLVSDVETIAGGYGLPPGAVGPGHPRDQAMCAVTVASGRPAVVPDTKRDPRVSALPLVVAGRVGAYVGVPLTDGAGNVVGAFCVYEKTPRTWTRADVTVLEELAAAAGAELERAVVTAERDAARVRLSLAMGAAGIGSWDWDLQTEALIVDTRMAQMAGYGPDELPLTMDSFQDRLHPDDAERVVAGLEACVEDLHEFDQEFRVVLPSGEVRWIATRGRTLTDDTGTPDRFVGAAYDTTARRKAEERAAAATALADLAAAASEALSGSLEVEDAARELARLVVPSLADWSIVSLVGQDGRLYDLQTWHRDPARRRVLRRFSAARIGDVATRGRTALVRRSGQPVFLSSGLTGLIEDILQTPEAVQALRELAPESGAVLPVIAGSRVAGILSLARGRERPPMSAAERAASLDITRRAGSALENAQLFSHERDMSSQLQRSLLDEPVQPDYLEVVVRYVPAARAAKVGGDWYDAFKQPDGATTLVIGDVVGHDSASAAKMGQLRTLVRGIAFSTGSPPAQVLTRVDQAMEGLRVDTTATAVVARMEVEPDAEPAGAVRLRWSNAGHPPPLLQHPDGTAHLLSSHDLLLGIQPGAVRDEGNEVIGPGTTLLLYTDGLYERRGEQLDRGLARLRRTVSSMASLSLPHLADALLDRLLTAEREDDVALILARVKEPG
jgi:PAS domain S-box-containing protein